jgi:hypothetical protein
MSPSDATRDWRDVLRSPCGGDHIVQVYEDEGFLADAVTEYVDAGLRAGEGAVIIAVPEHRRAFEAKIARAAQALASGQLRLLDAQALLETFMLDGAPDWTRFHAVVGGAVAEVRLEYPSTRLYGEMVDVLWQRGERAQAIRVEEFCNELARLQTLSLFCAYRMDNLDADAYGGPLESVCKVHTHLIPARDYSRFNQAVSEAAEKVLEQPLQHMLLSLAAHRRPGTDMPLGQAVLMWLQANMPRTAERVLSEVRTRC